MGQQNSWAMCQRVCPRVVSATLHGEPAGCKRASAQQTAGVVTDATRRGDRKSLCRQFDSAKATKNSAYLTPTHETGRFFLTVEFSVSGLFSVDLFLLGVT